ncbi:MAG: methyltransferase domain-containing protein [Bradymonadia bacterium]
MRAGLTAAREAGVEIAKGEKVDPFGDGWLIRHKKGFVPCPWAFDLARFTPARAGDRVLDLGTGNGVLLAAMRQVHPELGACIGVEIAERMLDQSHRNGRLTPGGFAVIRGDIRSIPVAPRAFDLVVSNPPFYPAGWGRTERHPEYAGATHALAGDVADFARTAAYALSPTGRVCFVFDASHLTALLLAFESASLTVKALRFLDDDKGRPARVLALAGRDGGGLGVDRR